MPSELESLDDLKRLIDAGYSISVCGAHLVVNDVYHLDPNGVLQKGKLAAPLNQPTPQTLGAPSNHQMYWSGSVPSYSDGKRIPMGSQDVNVTIDETVFTRHFSMKPPEGYPTYSSMVEHYVALISGPAEQKFSVTARTGVSYDLPPDSSPFMVRDTHSARAEITDLNQILARDRIAIVGIGGTGSYVLDFLVKSPVAAITAFDHDTLKVHNGFRIPGEVPIDQFGLPKTEVFRRKYEPFRQGLTFVTKRVGKGDEALFADVTFAFICIDDGETRGEICEMLTGLGVAFIDVGMGVEKEGGVLDGLLRTTLFTKDTATAAMDCVPTDAYRANGGYRVVVQLAELNALNAAMAVMRYKQFRGFYADDDKYTNVLFAIGSNMQVGEP